MFYLFVGFWLAGHGRCPQHGCEALRRTQDKTLHLFHTGASAADVIAL